MTDTHIILCTTSDGETTVKMLALKLEGINCYGSMSQPQRTIRVTLDGKSAEVAALRAACTLALSIMEQKNKVNVPSYVKTVTVDFAPEDIAVLRAALDLGEVERLRAEAKCADEEATMMANSDLATTEQVIRALRAEVAAHVARAAIVDDFNRTVASIVKQQPYETAELYDHPSQALKAMCDLIEDLQAENRKGPAKKP